MDGPKSSWVGIILFSSAEAFQAALKTLLDFLLKVEGDDRDLFCSGEVKDGPLGL
jgi:hypothetical protein